ncbi:MAG: hypothetical protein KDJ87_09860 [Rhizobiaceae bacterium]|nr:hypothetical protein [Rhizobiaceae bacterium]
MQIEISAGEVVIDARILAPLLDVAAEDVLDLMRKQAITSLCERGVDAHEGHYRLSFFYRNRRVRLSVDPAGQVLQHTTIDFGERELPSQLHKPGP